MEPNINRDMKSINRKHIDTSKLELLIEQDFPHGKDTSQSSECRPESLQQTLGQTEILEADRPELYYHHEPARQYLAWACPCL